MLANFIATQDLRGYLLIDEGSEFLLFNGIYTAFNSNWFLDVGQNIIGIMKLNIIMPMIVWLLKWTIRFVKRAWDQRSLFVGNYKLTQCKNIYEFVTIYSGPVFTFHEKIAYIWTNCVLAMCFGPVMPICYLYCLASLIVMYVVERLSMAYSYKQPPMFSNSMSKTLVGYLFMGPLMHYMTAISAFSNQQVFNNEVNTLKNFDMNPPSNQHLKDVANTSSPAIVYLIGGVL